MSRSVSPDRSSGMKGKECTGTSASLGYLDNLNENDSRKTDYMSALMKYGSLRSSNSGFLSMSDLGPFLHQGDYETFGWGKNSHEDAYHCSCDQGIKLSTCGASTGCTVDSNIVEDAIGYFEEKRCDVCLGPLSSDVSKCKGCGIYTHTVCYGLGVGSSTLNQFRCDLCDSKRSKDKNKPKCALCNLSGGSMRYSDSDDVWVHSSCVYFAPDGSTLRFLDDFNLCKPAGIKETLSGMNFNTSCDICNCSKGLLVPCAFPNCYKHLHTRCAVNRDRGTVATAFSEVVSYKSPLNKQYFVFKATFCQKHFESEFISSACQMALNRRSVVRPTGRSSYKKYQANISDILRMASATDGVHNLLRTKSGHGEDASAQIFLDFQIIPLVPLPSAGEWHTKENKPRKKFADWLRHFKNIQTNEDRFFEVDCDLNTSSDDDIKLNISIPEKVANEVLPMDEGQHVSTGEIADATGSQIRGQRLLWQKFEIFGHIPFGPTTTDILNEQDAISRRKSLQGFLPLDANVLSCGLLKPSELSECFVQQALSGCKGAIALLESIKVDLDSEVQNAYKMSSLTVQEKKFSRMHVLIDTGINCGILVFKVSKRLLEHIEKDLSSSEHQDCQGLETPDLFIDDETRHIIYQVQNELVRNVYASGSTIPSSKFQNGKDIDFLSGIAEFGLKDDIRYLNSAINTACKDDVLRVRRKIFKKSNSQEPSLKNLQLEKFIPLSHFECEILRRSALEMNQSANTTLKLAVMRDTVQATTEVSCLNFIDWPYIIGKLNEKIGDGGNKFLAHNVAASPARNNAPLSGNSLGTSLITDQMQSSSMGKFGVDVSSESIHKSSASMIRLGNWLWPHVEDADFLSKQQEFLEAELEDTLKELSKMRESLRASVLDENSAELKMAGRVDFTASLLAKYEAVGRWSDLVNYICLGSRDITDMPLTPPSSATSAAFLPSSVLHNSEMGKSTKRSEGVAESYFCSVCFRCVSTNLNPIYTCSRCYMNCHKNCYGVGRAGKEVDHADYICRRCEYEKRLLGSQWQNAFRSCSLLCAICGRGGGALKRCANDEWCHVFCLLALMPETVCDDYVSLEPWNIAGVSQWRREAECSVCCVKWGATMMCNDCNTAAHPLCAWFHGFKFTVVTNDNHLFQGFGKEVLFQRLHMKIQCNSHDENRHWACQMALRNKRFLNRDTAMSMFEGRGKRKKVSGQHITDKSIPTDPLDASSLADAPDIKNFSNVRRCGICFGYGNLRQCAKCKCFFHESCYFDDDSSDKTGQCNGLSDPAICQPLFCDPCRNSDHRAHCGICKKSSNVLKQLPVETEKPEYIHIICGVCFPKATVELCRGNHLDVLVGDSEVTDASNTAERCDICKSANGLKLECFRKDCGIKFHAICGLENRFVVEPHCMDVASGAQYVAFCQQHSLVNNSIGNNIKLLLRFRLNLILLRNVILDLSSKETAKQAWFRKRQEILNEKYPLNSVIQSGQQG